MSHSRWKTLRERKLTEAATEPAEVAEVRREIRLSMALAEAVYKRRANLGLTQSDLARRAGLSQAKISRIENSDTVPTLPLLTRLADALDAVLHIDLGGERVGFHFTPRASEESARGDRASTEEWCRAAS
ncbi:helix-turn-helix domain-containing protein [Streptomyces calidiresistens]|uniref:Helix-turn-helix domain-containing protein n=1 Tax=Streptomyces calidiresistens TaxID=1485586 RepID=A0A7W3SZD9_9ACTN|nr:helix-turn-helix domain-containing protein [Streptomyces calidiresistens]MBB0228119.1 helix-turn-helix domain-containing protein [Streptomyces calidiresistens]